MKNVNLSRRNFLHQTSAALAIAGVKGGNTAASGNPFPQAKTPATPEREPGYSNLGIRLKSYHIWDNHTHLGGFAGATTEEKVEDFLRFADRMGVERILLLTAASGGGHEPEHPDADGMRKMNDECIKAVRKAPDRIFGCAFMNPVYLDACMEEIERCVRNGPLTGLKFEFDTLRHPNEQPGNPTYDPPRDLSVLDPIFQRAAELKAVIIHHTWINTLGPENVAESTPMEVAKVASRYPTLTLLCGHTGGNWELGIRGIREYKNVYCDVSGSDPVAGFTEMAVRELGAERVLYGSDIAGRSFASQIGKVMGADLSEADRSLVLGGNLRRLMEPIMKAKGMKV